MNEINYKIKIGIADDHALFRKGIIKLLDPERYDCIFDVSNGETLLAKLEESKGNLPHIIIIDLEMPVMNGFTAVSRVNELYPAIKILVVTILDKEDAVVRMLKLGINGYLSKDMEPEELHDALQAIMHRDFYYNDHITNKMLHTALKSNNISGNKQNNTDMHLYWGQLNKGQKEFVRHACTDLTYDEIAEKMFVSPKTIDGYRDVVFNKFGVKNRVGLVLFAIKNGLVSI